MLQSMAHHDAIEALSAEILEAGHHWQPVPLARSVSMLCWIDTADLCTGIAGRQQQMTSTAPNVEHGGSRNLVSGTLDRR